MQVQRTQPPFTLQKPANWVVEGWRILEQPRTLASLVAVGCVEAARTYGNFSLTIGIYHGSLAGILAVFALAALPFVALNRRPGFIVAAILVSLSAISSATRGLAGLPLSAILGLLALLLAVHPSLRGPDDLSRMIHNVKNANFQAVLSTLSAATPMALVGLFISLSTITSAGPDWLAMLALGCALMALSVATFARNRYGLLLSGIAGIGLCIPAMLIVHEAMSSSSLNRSMTTWLVNGILPALVLSYVLWASGQLILDGRAAFLIERQSKRRGV